MTKKYWIACSICNNKILYFEKKFFIGDEVIIKKHFRLADGSKIENKDNDLFECQICGYNPTNLEFYSWIKEAQDNGQ